MTRASLIEKESSLEAQIELLTKDLKKELKDVTEQIKNYSDGFWYCVGHPAGERFCTCKEKAMEWQVLVKNLNEHFDNLSVENIYSNNPEFSHISTKEALSGAFRKNDLISMKAMNLTWWNAGYDVELASLSTAEEIIWVEQCPY